MKERQLSELKQEIKFLANEKDYCIEGIRFSLDTSDWLHIKRCAIRLAEIEGLLNLKGEQLLTLSVIVEDERRQEILREIC